jgi:hypothetical protein
LFYFVFLSVLFPFCFCSLPVLWHSLQCGRHLAV